MYCHSWKLLSHTLNMPLITMFYPWAQNKESSKMGMTYSYSQHKKFCTCSSISLCPCNNDALKKRKMKKWIDKQLARAKSKRKMLQGYLRNYAGCCTTSLRELPLSISANLNIHYIPISNRLSSTGNQVHAFYAIVILTSQAWFIINIIFLQCIMP